MDSELKQIEQTLKDGNLIDLNDSLEVYEKGDYWEKFLIFNNQIRGYYYFTKERIIFMGGALSSTLFNIRYKDIKEIKKCNISLFIPSGIKITVFDEKKNKDKTYKLSMLKRDMWIKFINDRRK